jgi:hypothetical protein
MTKGTTASRPWYGGSLGGRARTGEGTDRRSMVARPIGEGRRGTWHGETLRRFGVLPASGRCGLGKARVGPDAEAAIRRTRGRAGALELGRRCGLPESVGLATFD